MVTRTAARTLILFLLLCGLSQYGLSSSTLNFPRISNDSGTFTGLAFVNPSAAQAQITLTAYGPSGTLVRGSGIRNPVTLTVPAGRQIARVLTDSDMFGNLPANQASWVQATSNTDGITGFFLFLNGSITTFDGADLPQVGRKIVFHAIQDDADASTEVNIINPGTTATNLDLTLFVPSQGPIVPDTSPSLPAHGVLRFSPRDFFGVDSIPAGSYLVVNSNTNLGGFEFIRVPGQDLLGLNAVPSGDVQQVLYFPQMAVRGPWTTTLGLVNYSNESVLVTISAFTPDGALYSGSQVGGENPKTVGLAPNGALYQDVEQLFGFTGDETILGWLKVSASSASLNGFISYGLEKSGATGGSLAAVTSQATALSYGLFSHIATTQGYFTGLALLNPGQIANPYRVAAFKQDGSLLGTFDGVLRPGQRVSQVINEFVKASAAQSGGFILVRSTQPLYMTSLFGTASVLANIPAQPAPTSFAPDSGQPTVKVNPPLAVVQPKGTNKFSLTGVTGSPVWKVNGIANGNPTVGRIDSTGLYTAPTNIPDPLPVTVSAEIARTDATPISGGATVDVLTKETLVSGTGQVLSVAFLKSLQRLYTAELAGTAGSQAGSVSPAAAGTSEIYQDDPTIPGSRQRLLSRAGAEFAKILAFPLTVNPQTQDVKEYLLLLDKTGGQILRYDPAAANSGTNPSTVISGLSSPSSIALDPTTGNLLVAESQQISTFSRSQLTSGLSLRRRPGSGPELPTQIAGNLPGAPEGIAVDACTGNIFVSLDNGRILRVDRLSGQYTEAARFELAGEVLGLYRNEIPCPTAFQLLVADPGTGRVQLFDPSGSFPSFTWLSNVQARDLAYLPIGNELTGSAGILLGDLIPGGGGDVSLVRTPGLYTDKQANVPLVVAGTNVADPRGDTFGTSGYQIDITQVWIDRPQFEPFVSIYVEFTEPVAAPGSGNGGNEVYGFIDFDTDQNESTGASSYIDFYSPYASNLGVDYQLAFYEYNNSDYTLPLYRFDAQSGEFVPTGINAYAYFEGPSVFIQLALPQMDPDGLFNFAVVLGNDLEPTDAAPNGGYLTTGN